MIESYFAAMGRSCWVYAGAVHPLWGVAAELIVGDVVSA